MREVGRVSAILLCVFFVALVVQPQTATVEGGVGADIDYVFTIINDGPVPVEVELRAHPFSTYLEDAVSLSEQRFFLLAQESANVQVRGEVPLLGPEVHLLRYELVAQGAVQGEFVVEMPVEGVADLEPRLRVSSRDIAQGSSLVVDATLSNFGNVLAYYDLSLEVLEQGVVVGELRYPQPVQVLPGAEERVTLLFTDFLEPGDYVVRVSGLVNEQEVVDAQVPVRVTLVSEEQRIFVGDDLLVELKRYDSTPRVSYSVSSGGEELFSETVLAEGDVLTIPTSSLGVGVYDVSVAVVSNGVSDSQEFLLVVERSRLAVGWLGWLVLLAALVWALFSSQSRLYLRIWWLSIRLHYREKRLNRLIYRAHALEREYGS